MALPSRRALIGLSVRLNRTIYEVESWDVPTIREYFAYFTSLDKKDAPESADVPVADKLLAHPMFATQKE